MAGVVPNAAEVDVANYTLNKSTPQDLLLKLYVSNTTPAETDTAGTFTEATEDGYAAITLNGAAWTVNSGNPTSASTAAQVFDITETGSFYGYFGVRATSGVIAFAERFSGAPFVLPGGGGEITVTPTYTFT
jgi:hypothetical protein